MTDGMILHPEYDALRAEAERLRDELARAINDRDHLRFHHVPWLEGEYMIKLGGLEYRAYELELKAARLRRKAQLIQARLNQGLPVHMEEIEAQLDEEFEGYHRRVAERLSALEAALKRREGTELLSEQDAAELRRLYRQAVKRLHPDLHADDEPEQAARRARLFASAMAAYENGDLPAMQTVIILMEDLDDIEAMELIDELRAKARMLAGLCADVRDEIEAIRASFPCDIEELLMDDAWVMERADELRGQIAALCEASARYEERLAEMMRTLS